MPGVERVLAIASGMVSGALVLSGAVAIVAFGVLGADREHAGQVAAGVFVISYWAALAAAGAVLALRPWRRRTRGVDLSAVALGMVAAFELGAVVPAIRARGVGWPLPFAAWHGLGSGLHLVLCALALTLSWLLAGGPPARPDSVQLP